MTRPEVTNTRSLEYSRWHRENLSPSCYCMDLDWIEWRDSRGIVALIETKRGLDTPLRRFQFEVYTELSRRSGVPLYLVNHTEDMRHFRVTHIQHDQEYQERPAGRLLDAHQYAEFLEGLGVSSETGPMAPASIAMEDFI